ncbi:PIN domain-containing protein [Halobaculum roseum]|uniref:PIN domain-containing protein n=1 Tax=Halobaculum roseum TaxID=2175149 RepID=A0ABD5MMT8_9EURY|nr:PIN domain-containing protein [Halobaculum roseum]QZY04110.1 twitching motility protein PilT [Halobaculum roseum]
MVVLDTNALMMPVECGVRVFEELDRLVDDPELVTPEAVVAELETLAAGAGEEATAASVGRDLAERCRVVETAQQYADDAVVELAAGGAGSGADADTGFDGYVVTNDRPLRERLLARGVRVIGLRGANTLAITQP